MLPHGLQKACKICLNSAIIPKNVRYQRVLIIFTKFFFPVKIEILHFILVEISTGNTSEISTSTSSKCELELQILWFRDNSLWLTRSSCLGPLTTCDPALESLGSQLSNAGSHATISILVAEIFAFSARWPATVAIFRPPGGEIFKILYIFVCEATFDKPS